MVGWMESFIKYTHQIQMLFYVQKSMLLTYYINVNYVQMYI